ncbi:MAG: DUF1810 domain-containing protein [Acetobacteraceae bacterium]
MPNKMTPVHDESDPFDLERFVEAQAPVFQTALSELKAGRKRSHWMWFIFPQLSGLGHSPRAERYGLASLGEARADLAHQLLAPRLERCAEAVLLAPAPSLNAIFGSPDDMKFHSSMTIFALAANAGETAYRSNLERWLEGRLDPRTLDLIPPEERPF